MSTRAAMYAGTFDPLTLGHMDLVERGADIFDKLLLAVAVSTPKATLFNVDERIEMACEACRDLRNVEIVPFDGLLVEFARRKGVYVLLRGLRAYSDFESEFQMALTNRKLAPEVETFFMMPKETHSYVSSSTVKQIAALGADASDFVPAVVVAALKRKFNRVA